MIDKTKNEIVRKITKQKELTRHITMGLFHFQSINFKNNRKQGKIMDR